jgi:hypothetical protein
MRKLLFIGLAGIMLLAMSCGGGGGDNISSDANRFIGDWNGTMVNTGRDDGQPLGANVALKIHMEYAGKETIGGMTVYYISVSIYQNGILFVSVPAMQALPGGTWIIDIAQSDCKVKMLGQFIGNTASGSFEVTVKDPNPPNSWVNMWGTWTASR